MKPRLLLSIDYLCAMTGTEDQRAPDNERFYSLRRLQKACKRGRIPTEQFRVKTICGSSVREFADVAVSIEGQDRDVWVQLITGSLFDQQTGRCLSGPLEIV